MAVPKKRTSVSRKGLRRAGQHHKLYATHTISCPNCAATMLSHHVCPSCGHYRGVKIFDLKVKKTKTQEEEAPLSGLT